MKIRSGFVSNSSSSSFLVIKDLSKFGINCVKLNENQISYLKERYTKEMEAKKEGEFSFISESDFEFVNSHNELWVTQFISDCSKLNDKINDKNILKKGEYIYYFEGELSEEPRDGEYFNCLKDCDYDGSVWIYQEDDKDRRKMTVKEITDILKKKKKEGKVFDVTSFGNEILIKIKNEYDD